MAHQEKMKAINQKFEEEKKMCENSYNQNMLKIDLNNDSNNYYYYQNNQNLYPNQNYELKTGNVGIIEDNINVHLNSKNVINPNLSPEEKRKMEYKEREKKRKQRELERKRREAKNTKLTEENILKKEQKDKEFIENYEKEYEKRSENFKKDMKNKLNLDGPIDFDNIMNNIESLPNKEELIKIMQEQNQIKKRQIEEQKQHEKELKQIEQKHLENIEIIKKKKI